MKGKVIVLEQRKLPCGCRIRWNENKVDVVMCEGHSSEFERIHREDDYEEQQFVKQLITPSKQHIWQDIESLAHELI
jgi:hypothetical protein